MGKDVSEDSLSGAAAGERGIDVRIPLDDASCIDASCLASDAGVGEWISTRDVVPVRYDPADHSNVEIDLPFLQEHLDEASFTPLGSWHPIERLRRLTDLHDNGLLSDDEFAEAQANIIDG